MVAIFQDIALVRRLAYFIGAYLTKNLVYTMQLGNIKIKRKVGIGFLKLRRNSLKEQFLVNINFNGEVVYDV